MRLIHLVFLLAVLDCSLQFCTAIQRRVGAFNIQIFGFKKAQNKDVMKDLVQILQRYDLVLIQEIREKKDTAIESLLLELNNASVDQYDMKISSRLGKSTSTEQYCYFYKLSVFEIIDVNEYPDECGHFERPPFNVLFRDKGDNKKFFASGLHAKPSNAVRELDQMSNVYEFIQTKFGPSNVLMMGDFNADCDYVRAQDWSRISLWTDKRFHWLIDNNVDTTVARRNCAYDRIVFRGSLNVHSGRVYIFSSDPQLHLQTSSPEIISDHYPVEVYVDP